ncbi:MAG: hypothetical protein ACRBBN_20950 [Methyloligellaceae bacterium]
MNAQLTIIMKDHVVAYARGLLNKKDEVIVEDVIRNDDRARLVYDKVKRDLYETEKEEGK